MSYFLLRQTNIASLRRKRYFLLLLLFVAVMVCATIPRSTRATDTTGFIKAVVVNEARLPVVGATVETSCDSGSTWDPFGVTNASGIVEALPANCTDHTYMKFRISGETFVTQTKPRLFTGGSSYSFPYYADIDPEDFTTYYSGSTNTYLIGIEVEPYAVSYWNMGGDPTGLTFPSGLADATEEVSYVEEDFGGASPAVGINNEDWVAAYTKTVTLGEGWYELAIDSDDGARVYFDDEIIINNWTTRTFGSVTLSDLVYAEAGTHTVRVEYYQHTGGSQIAFDIHPFEFPIQYITTCEQLQGLSENADDDDTILLMNDINCGGSNFYPLDWFLGFRGVFDGQNYTISNLTITDTGSSGTGLFSLASGATFRNVHFTNAQVSNNADNVGVLLAAGYDVSISNVSVSGTVAGDYAVGSVAGFLSYESPGSYVLNNLSSDVIVSNMGSDGEHIGGLIGLLGISRPDGDVSIDLHDNFFTGAISPLEGYTMNNAGGLIGSAAIIKLFGGDHTITLHDSFSEGDISGGGEEVGGLVGSVALVTEMGTTEDGSSIETVIQNSSSTMSVWSNGDSVGGLVGYVDIQSGANIAQLFEVATSTASGDVTGDFGVGGLLGSINISASDDASHQVHVVNSSATGDVAAYAFAGGLIGGTDYSDDNITLSSNATGGLLVEKSFATGSIVTTGEGNGAVGGLIGGLGCNIQNTELTACSISQSYTTGEVSGMWDVGGFVGFIEGSTRIQDSYAVKNVTGSVYVGGLIGEFLEGAGYSGNVISRSYVAGSVTTVDISDFAGGLIGKIDNGSLVVEDVFATNGLSIFDYDDGDYVGALFGWVGMGNSFSGLVYKNGSYACASNIDIVDCTSVGHQEYFYHNIHRPMNWNWDFATIWTTDGAGLPLLRVFGNSLTDFSLPIITYADPTPEDGSEIGESSFSVALDSEALGDRNYRFVDFDSSLVGWWDFNDSILNRADEENSGTLDGVFATTTGQFNNAYDFNGSSYFTIDRPIEDDFTICAWIKTTGVGNGDLHYLSTPIFESETIEIENDFGFGIDSSGHIAFGTGNVAEGTDPTINSINTVNDGEWHHVCGVRVKSSGSLKVYIDGGLDIMGVGSTTTLSSNPQARIGAGGDAGGVFSGGMDELLVFSRALDYDEISALYNGDNPYEHTFGSLADGVHTFLGYMVTNSNGVYTASSTESRVTISRPAPTLNEPTASRGTGLGVTYSASSISYAPLTLDDPVTVDYGGDTDDDITGLIDIPFAFTFYGLTYNSLAISTNGFITFSDLGDNNGCCRGPRVPGFDNGLAEDIHNIIAAYWTDLVLDDGVVQYDTIGTAPNRKFVIEYSGAQLYNGPDSEYNGQIVLYEGSNIIEIHTTSAYPDDQTQSYVVTQGIENIDGSQGLSMEGRNGARAFSLTHDAVRYSPTGTRNAFRLGDTPLIQWDATGFEGSIADVYFDVGEFLDTPGWPVADFNEEADLWQFELSGLNTQENINRNIATIVVDEGDNSYSVTSTANYSIDTIPPADFDTGLVQITGGTVVPSELNYTNTDVSVAVPIADDPSLVGGYVYIQVEDSGDFGTARTIGNPHLIDAEDLGSTVTIHIAISEVYELDDLAGTEFINFIGVIIDNAGNVTIGDSSENIFAVEVENLAPEIELVGPHFVFIYARGIYEEPGVVASDFIDGDLTDSIVYDDDFPTAFPGYYTSSYSVTNSRGITTEDSRGVVVVATTSPVIIEEGGDNEINVLSSIENPLLDISEMRIDDFSITTWGAIDIHTETEISDVTVTIPHGTTITSAETWDGVMRMPLSVPREYASLPSLPGYSISFVWGMEIGLEHQGLILDRGVRMKFPNQAGKKIGVAEGDVFSEITDICTADTQEVGDALPSGEDCKIDSGDDLVVWTKHFSSFFVYTATPLPSGNSNPVGSIFIKPNVNKPWTPAPVPPVTVTPPPVIQGYQFTRVLKQGMSGDDVRQLQIFLNRSGYQVAKVGPGSSGAETTYFGAATKAALVNYQRANGISPTELGVVGISTQELLNSGLKKQTATPHEPTTNPSGYNFKRNLQTGSRGDDVIALQKFLISNGFSIPAGATGLFGPQTQKALSAFQKAMGINPAVGYFGSATRAVIK